MAMRITSLDALVQSAAYRDPQHPAHAKLMAEVGGWIDRAWEPMPPAMRADFLQRLAASGAHLNPRHPKHAELQSLTRTLLGSMPWIHAPAALDPIPDPATADIGALMLSPANTDPASPLHAATRARIEEHYATMPGGDEPVL